MGAEHPARAADGVSGGFEGAQGEAGQQPAAGERGTLSSARSELALRALDPPGQKTCLRGRGRTCFCAGCRGERGTLGQGSAWHG